LETVSESYVHGDLYPVLLILGRLYPSSLEGTDSNLQVHKINFTSNNISTRRMYLYLFFSFFFS
jgi:hypothetical protein